MSKPVILCVDDEKMILSSLKEQLRRNLEGDFILEIVESGEEALEVVEELLEEQIELPLVISDHIMPGIKGDELVKEIHRLSPKTLNILLTGQANADAVGYALNHARLYRYIGKPWEEADLVKTVKQAICSYFQDKKTGRAEVLVAHDESGNRIPSQHDLLSGHRRIFRSTRRRADAAFQRQTFSAIAAGTTGEKPGPAV